MCVFVCVCVLMNTFNQFAYSTPFSISLCRNLFHILTIGSSKPEHELYGFHRGYFVSPHHVAEAIRNFVAYFFSCDVCRTHYLVSQHILPQVFLSDTLSYSLSLRTDSLILQLEAYV